MCLKNNKIRWLTIELLAAPLMLTKYAFQCPSTGLTFVKYLANEVFIVYCMGVGVGHQPKTKVFWGKLGHLKT